MDLERMHDELYRGRYCTPQDFLDDVAKISRNAKAWAHKDLDILHQSQCMYTFAEVSILKFDPTLRMDCERMAVQERKRHEENRKIKDKLKGEGRCNTAAKRKKRYVYMVECESECIGAGT
jgi:hypothetical protein